MLRQKVVVGGGVLSVSSQCRDSIPCFRSCPLRQLARPSIRFGGFLLDSSSSFGHSGLTSHDKCSNVLRFTCNSRWKKALRLERGDSPERDNLFLAIMSELDMIRSSLLTSIQTRPIVIFRGRTIRSGQHQVQQGFGLACFCSSSSHRLVVSLPQLPIHGRRSVLFREP